MTSITRTGPNIQSLGRWDTAANLETDRPGASEYPGTTAYTDDLGYRMSDGTSWRSMRWHNIAALSAAYTLTSTTNSQALFNIPTNGALTVPAATAYLFEGLISLSSMSATSGNFGLDILGAGTATLTSIAWAVHGLDATTQTTAAAVSGAFSAISAQTADILVASTGTAAHFLLKGLVRVNAAGTLIPSIKLTTAAAAVVGVNSYIDFTPIGIGAVTTVGPWA